MTKIRGNLEVKSEKLKIHLVKQKKERQSGNLGEKKGYRIRWYEGMWVHERCRYNIYRSVNAIICIITLSSHILI